jgi:shikimate dehydrogenase
LDSLELITLINMPPYDLQTFELGLIGYPLGHSLSPQIHAAALKSCGLEGGYSLFPIHPEDKNGLRNLLARLRNGEITGLNVTIPHKQNVIALLDELMPTAKAIGAVNTIYRHDHNLVGDNTDAPGFLSDLQRVLPVETKMDAERNALVLGAGGSARAIVYALLNTGWNIFLAARRMEQAADLAQEFGNVRLMEYDLQTFKHTNVQLIVNTTPIGMAPNIDKSPWPETLLLPPDAAIYDLVYNPRETKLVREACLQSLSATTGIGMLIEQAALAFEIWTGDRPSREAMFAAVNEPAH